MIQELAGYWATDYDWRRCEATLNALPHFITEIDGLDIHFIHVRSRHEDALPLIVTHGWPGSIIEQLKIIGPLTDPTAHGAARLGRVPPGHPVAAGIRVLRQAAADRLGPRPHRPRLGRAHEAPGYPRFASQGGDWGGAITNVMGQQAPPELLGIHVNFPATVPPGLATALQHGDPPPATLPADEKHAYEQLTILYARRRAYAAMMGTRPQTLYGLADSPVGLAAWLLDHGDGWGQPAAPVTSAVLGSHQPRTPRRRPHPRRRPGQHHAVLADRHGSLCGPPVLGKQGQPVQRCRDLGPGGRDRLSRRELPGPAQLDTAGVPQPHLLQQTLCRRPLRGLGTAAALRSRSPRGP